MLLKTKLSLGLGFLFLIIFILTGFCAYYVGRSSQDAENILKNNYDSIVYARKMLAALDEMLDARSGPVAVSEYARHRYEAGVTAFENNLKSEGNNITEVQEADLVQQLNSDYQALLKLGRRPLDARGHASGDYHASVAKVRQVVNAIYDLNLQAVVRKSQLAKRETSRFINSMAMIGAVCVLLALAYFWYFPFYMSSTYGYLSTKMGKLLGTLGITYEAKTNDEALNILHAIDLIENKLGPRPVGKKGAGRTP